MKVNRLPLLQSVVFTSLLVAGCNEATTPFENNSAKVNDATIQLTGRVVDQADLLDIQVEKILTEKLARLEREAGPQFVIVTTDSLNGLDIVEYSVDLGRRWAIGHSERDDGVILLVAPNERKVRIAVGYGLEGSLSDPFCAKVIREDILPAFEDGKMEEGIVSGADSLIAKMRTSPTIKLNDNELPLTLKEKQAS